MKTAFFFPGYGSQSVGFGKELYDEYRIVQEYLEEASHCLSINMGQLCFASSTADINRITAAYPVVTTMSVALSRLVGSMGIKADLMCGYDQGVWAALCASGSMTFPDVLYVVNKIADRYQAYIDQGDFRIVEIQGIEKAELAAVGASVSRGHHIVAMAYELDTNTYGVSGQTPYIVQLQATLTGNGYKIKERPVGHGLHSPLMHEVVESVMPYLVKVDCHKSEVAILDPITYRAVKSKKILEHCMQSLETMVSLPKTLAVLSTYDTIILMGSDEKTQSLLLHYYPDKKVFQVATKKDIEELTMFYSANGILTKEDAHD